MHFFLSNRRSFFSFFFLSFFSSFLYRYSRDRLKSYAQIILRSDRREYKDVCAGDCIEVVDGPDWACNVSLPSY
jgi:hypothetical protein